MAIILSRGFLSTLVALILFAVAKPAVHWVPATVQGQGIQAAEFIEDNQAVDLSFHKVVNGKEGPALDLTDSNLKFATGDTIRVEYKAPFDSYIYIVNATTSGRTEVQYPRRQEQNLKIPANEQKGFSFRLTNPGGVSGVIKEDLVFVISPSQVNNPTFTELL